MNNQNNVHELRNILFDTLRGLKDGSIKPDQAKLINATAQTIINSVQAETHMLDVIGGKGSGFIGAAHPAAIPEPYKPSVAGQLAQMARED